MIIDRNFWHNRRVLVTGHAGFKGSWLCEWLMQVGADVIGYGRHSDRKPSLFRALELEHRIDAIMGDIRDSDHLKGTIRRRQPEIIFHLAAQPLVRAGLKQPVDTFETNVQGSVNVLDAVRDCRGLKAVVIVTSDKCYEPSNMPRSEQDRLGGRDPYSASKACAELATASFTSSFFDSGRKIGVATARAGNVLGGGDMGRDRLMPDLVTAILGGSVAEIRYPGAIRPWQHVLDALNGYLLLAENLAKDPARCTGPWNFGPAQQSPWTVGMVADEIVRQLGKGRWQCTTTAHPIETRTLQLRADKSREGLGWCTQLDVRETVAWSIEGYRALLQSGEIDWLPAQINRFMDRCRSFPLTHSIGEANQLEESGLNAVA